jgi:DNA-damage-inducible protein D
MNEDERLSAQDSVSPFERIRRTNASGAEYWSGRDFAQVLGYSDYRNCEQVIKKAKTTCFNSAHRVEDHFGDIAEMVGTGGKAQCPLRTVLLSHCAFHLTVQNANLTKRILAPRRPRRGHGNLGLSDIW